MDDKKICDKNAALNYVKDFAGVLGRGAKAIIPSNPVTQVAGAITAGVSFVNLTQNPCNEIIKNDSNYEEYEMMKLGCITYDNGASYQ